MNIIESAKKKFIKHCSESKLDLNRQITVKPLSVKEAVGDMLPDDFPIKRGKEQVIEAVFNGTAGQAFTDHPVTWKGSLEEVVNLDITLTRNRAIFIAALNAVLSHLNLAAGVIHCKDDEPLRCGAEVAEQLFQRFGQVRVALVGLQPAFLQNLVKRFGSDFVRVVDLNSDNIGSVKCGVKVLDGETELESVAEWCNIGLSTGSSVVNGTIDNIASCFDTAGKPLIFFGNTISGTAALMDLDRICPFGE